jgi:hypothetical protein
MKTKSLFWGLFFIALGGLIFADQYNYIGKIDWYFLRELWPLIFVFIGLIIIAKDTFLKPLIAVIFAIFLALFVYSLFQSSFYWHYDNDRDDDWEYSVERITEEFDSTVQYANLTINAGAGRMILDEDTDELLQGKLEGQFKKHNFDSRKKDSTAWLKYELKDKNFKVLEDNSRNRLEFDLNKNPVWDLNLNIGAADADFYLKDLKVQNLVMKAGAADVEIRLGDEIEKTYVNVDMGAAKLTLNIPRGSGCKLTGEMVLVAKNLDDFYESSDGVYVTDNYETAQNKILVDFNSGVSSLSIDRY